MRRRDDVLKECATSGSSFLVLVYRDGDHQPSRLRIGVFEVPMTLRMSVTSVTSGERLRLLSSNLIPEAKRWNLANPQFDFHAPSARLSISSTNELFYYDISAYAPDISARLVFDHGHSSLFPLTGTLAAGALSSGIKIYDMKYKSVKARLEVNTKSKRKDSEDNAPRTVRFLSYFAKLNVLLAVCGRDLLIFDMTREGLQRWNSSQGGGLLIDSLGCSTYASASITARVQAEIGPGFSKIHFMPNKLEMAGWEARQRKLDELVQQNQAEIFEVAMASDLLEVAAGEAHRAKHSPLKLPSDEQFVSYNKIHYLLSKIFCAIEDPSAEYRTDKGANIVVAFSPPRLLRWLARRSHLSTSEIKSALRGEHPQLQLRLGAVAQSIMEQDPSLSLLVDYLQGANLSGLDEAVIVVSMLIKDAVSLARREAPTEQLSIGDFQRTVRDQPAADGDGIIASGSQAAAPAGGWSRECITAINHALEILCGFSPSEITLGLRNHLATEEALALVQFLRQQLFRGGYTSSFSSFSWVSEDEVLSLRNTVLILSGCIDAIGPRGFLDSTTDQGLWQGLVPDLKTEISLALAGIEEATYLKGVLQEMVRYGSAAGNTEVLSTDPTMHRFGESVTETGRLVRRYAVRLEEQGQDLYEQPPLLPLSLAVENTVTKTKKRKGGGEDITRSARELQYLKNRSLGRYSFERLIV